ncbi:MAG: thioredoxin domain-containing protein [Candidatus Aminicenantes bacterium]|nr:thioredoxin domain-containing protein [Candidatus Aminicenantes bacterium]
MKQSLTSEGVTWKRILSFISGAGMAAASALTVQHFFLANYPESIFEGSFCDINAFFNCDSSAFSSLSQLMGVPIGVFGFIVGALVMMGALFPSKKFELTNSFISLANMVGVVFLFLYSILVNQTLCLLCLGYYVFSLLSFCLFVAFSFKKDNGFLSRFFNPSFKMLVTFAVISFMVSFGMFEYHEVRKEAQEAAAIKVVTQFYELPVKGNPSFISPYWTVRSTEEFEEAPIHIVEYGDYLCSDCLYLEQQFSQLKEEFSGKINVAFQFFPLEGKCNSVVDKDIHPGSCELTYYAAADPSQFTAIHDEIFANFNLARTSPEWREELALRYGVYELAQDPSVREMVDIIVNTGREYEKTSDRYDYGIRSTPTMIINGRMVIGTLTLEQMRAIFQALVDEQEKGKNFMEHWVPIKLPGK